MNETKSCARCVLKAVTYLWLYAVHTMAALGLVVLVTVGTVPLDDALWLDEDAFLTAMVFVLVPAGLLYLLWSLTGPQEKPKA